jgi:L-fuconolactonase
VATRRGSTACRRTRAPTVRDDRDPLIVDTHVHVISSDRTRYPLRPTGVGSPWYFEVDADVDRFARESADAGVERAVLVQPVGAYGYDNTYLFAAADAYPDRFVSVPAIDLRSEAAPGELRVLAMQSRGAGVRLFAIANGVLIDDPAILDVWEVAAEHDLVVVVTILADQVPRLASVVSRFPSVAVALDHCGFPDLSGGVPYAKASALRELAGAPNLTVKVSGHLLARADAPDELVAWLAEVFGPDRLLWGSDYAQTHDARYATLVERGQDALARLGSAARADVLGGNALRLWPRLLSV